MKNLYKYSPVFLQNLFITVVNNYKYYQKYGAIPLIKPLKKVISGLDPESLNDNDTLKRINNLIIEAVQNVPYYRENKEKYRPISSISELNTLPVLKKETLKVYNEKFISEKVNRFNSYNFRTSGSTGTPIKGAVSNRELRIRHKIILTSMKLQGIDYSLPVARFLGSYITEGNSKVYRKDLVNKHCLFSIYDLSAYKIHEYYNALKINNICIIEGYPSTIYSLVKLMKENGYVLKNVSSVITTAEKLLDHQRELIENYFNVNIFDYYGSSEGSVYMYLNNNKHYLNSNKIGYFETVDDELNNVIGVPGRMLITSFTSSFTPLIRYDIGDICEIIENTSQLIKVSEIIGRDDDVFISPNGTEFSRFSLVLKYLPREILESQLVLWQYTNRAEVHYLSNEPIELDEFIEFKKKLENILKMNFNIKFIHIDKFKKLNRGKLTAVKILKK